MTEPTYEELKARLAELEAKQQRTGSMSFKVSDKGGVSVYGLGRFPVTLVLRTMGSALGQSAGVA
jgi:hypothetical protein